MPRTDHDPGPPELTREQEETAMALASVYQSVSPSVRADGTARVLCFRQDPPEPPITDDDADVIVTVAPDGRRLFHDYPGIVR